MGFKLAVADRVKVPVKFTIRDGGAEKTFAFTLECERLSDEAIKARLKNEEEPVNDFMRDVARGWSGQKLVLNEEGEPAEFSAEAFDAMLNMAGVGVVLFKAYLAECGAKAKN